MARFFGEVGYGIPDEDVPDDGISVLKMEEFPYQGDVIRTTRTLQNSEASVNDNISIGNSISIVADEYAIENFINIKYVRWSGVRWIVTNVEVQRPRLILSLGGVYNGPTP